MIYRKADGAARRRRILLIALAVVAAMASNALAAAGSALRAPSLAGQSDGSFPSLPAQGDRAASQVVVIVVDKLAMEDFADYPDALSELIARIPRGAIGMMNVRTAAAANSANGYLSLSTGQRASAGAWAGRALMVHETHLGEPAGRVYQGLTGRRPHGAIVHLGIGELIRGGSFAEGASDQPSAAASRTLGSILHQHGRVAALFGNSDALGERRRYGALLAMDQDGVIAAGRVDEGVLVSDPAFPGGMRTDYDAVGQGLEKLGLDLGLAGQLPGVDGVEAVHVLGRIRSAPPHVVIDTGPVAAQAPTQVAAIDLLPEIEAGDAIDLVVVDLGDLARLEAAEPLLAPGRASALRGESLRRIAAFVASLLDGAAQTPPQDESADPRGRPRRVFYVISPSPTTWSGRGSVLLTPILRWEFDSGDTAGKTNEATGILTSPTTRRRGIVTNADFLPSILADLGLSPTRAAGGRVWETTPHPEALETLLNRYVEIKSVHQQRLPVIQPYFLALLTLFIVGALLIVLVRFQMIPDMRRFAKGWRFLTTTFLAAPAALLLLALFPPTPLVLTWTLFAGLSLALSLVVHSWSRRRRRRSWIGKHPGAPAGLMGLLTAGLLIIDVALGAPLMQKSLLGYDPVAGSRYYGIGNEYMGVLIGAALLGCALIVDGSSAKRAKTLTSPALQAALDQPYQPDPDPVIPARWLPAVVFGLITFLMIHPRLGINVGGAITAACTGVAATFLTMRRPFTLRAALAWGGAVVLLIMITAFLDTLFLREEASHLGQVVQSVGDGSADPLWTLFGRKVAMNLRLIRLTVWSRVVFAAFAFLVVTVCLPGGIQRGLGRRAPGLAEMTKAGLIGALVALAANDSGVVAASTLLLWPVLGVLSVLPEVVRAARRSRPAAIHKLP